MTKQEEAQHKENVRLCNAAASDMAKCVVELRAVLDKHAELTLELRSGALEIALATERAIQKDIEAFEMSNFGDEDDEEDEEPRRAGELSEHEFNKLVTGEDK